MDKKEEWTQIGVRVQKPILKQLAKAAKRSGLTVASYLRSAALEKAKVENDSIGN